jgi:hypothetical protein
MSKCHKWTPKHDDLLKTAIYDCYDIFEHYKTQNKSYGESNAWDAVAGRLLPDVCVTGAACRRRWDILKEKEKKTENYRINCGWSQAIEAVEKYEKELAEVTFDGVSELLGEIDALHIKMDKLIKLWE